MIKITDGSAQHIRIGGGGGGIQIFGPAIPTDMKLTATTTAPSQTVTLQRITPTGGTCVVNWGDGSADSTIANGNTGSTAHVYATAGTWQITISNASLMTYLDLQDAKISWAVGPASPMPTGLISLRLISLSGLTWAVGGAGATMPTGLTTLTLYNLSGLTWAVGGAGAAMPTGLTILSLYNLSGLTWAVGGAGAAMPTGLTNLYLVSLSGLTWAVGGAGAAMPTGLTTMYLGTLSGLTWAVGGAGATMPTGLTTMYLYNLSGLTWAVGGAGAAMPTGLTSLTYQNSLTQAAVNSALWGLYQGTTTRTATGGTIIIATTNAAPSGTFQAPASCPVTVATPGKEIAHALLNDGCAVGFNRWTTVTITA